MTIYDRWGVPQYSSNNRENPWNGLNQEGLEVPEGTYYYHVMVGEREFAGDVTLVR